ncbi:hypothetical protein [Megasphaera sp.]|uniref:hypothetical protein n=1 Tax=Megasphaera sp. TaxID=2023260 RepID=UPI0035211060
MEEIVNKKEKEFLENNLYFNYLRRLRTQADMKNDKSKQARIMAQVSEFAAEEAEVICRHLIPGLDVESVKKRAKETFELEKG